MLRPKPRAGGLKGTPGGETKTSPNTPPTAGASVFNTASGFKGGNDSAGTSPISIGMGGGNGGGAGITVRSEKGLGAGAAGMTGAGSIEDTPPVSGLSFSRGISALSIAGTGGAMTGKGCTLGAGTGSGESAGTAASGSASAINLGLSLNRIIGSGSAEGVKSTGGTSGSTGGGGVAGAAADGVTGVSSLRTRGRRRKGGGWDSSLIGWLRG